MGTVYNVDGNGNETIAGIFNSTSITNGSLAISRLTSTQIGSISSPVLGMLVFDITNNILKYYNGTSFVPVSMATSFSAIANCRVAQTTNLVATYSNGVSGVGATLTAVVPVGLVVDGVTLAVNDRVLVQNQTLAFQNGIYFVTNIGSGVISWILTRSLDYDQSSEIANGNFTISLQGTFFAGVSWLQTAMAPVVIGTNPIIWSQFSTPLTLTAGFGINIVGNTISVIAATFLQSANNLSDLTNVATARTNLGLGTMAVQNANAVAITGGSVNGTTIGAATATTGRFTTLTDTGLGLGIVHSSAGGLFSSSLIVNADITPATILGNRIAGSTVTNGNLVPMPAHTFKGNNTAGAINPLDLTIPQMQAELGIPAGGSIGGTIANAQVAFGTAANTIGGTANFTYASGSGVLSLLTGGINLKTTGGASSQLDFYQESTGVNITIGGAVASQTFVLTFTRVGNLVTVRWTDLPAVAPIGTTNTITGTTPIPVIFRPTPAMTNVVNVIHGLTPISIALGYFSVLTGGNIIFGVMSTLAAGAAPGSSGRAPFNSSFCGIVGGSTSWIV